MTNVKINSSRVEEFKKFAELFTKWTQFVDSEIEFAVFLYTRKINGKPAEDVWLEFVKTDDPQSFKIYVLHDIYPN